MNGPARWISLVNGRKNWKLPRDPKNQDVWSIHSKDNVPFFTPAAASQHFSACGENMSKVFENRFLKPIYFIKMINFDHLTKDQPFPIEIPWSSAARARWKEKPIMQNNKRSMKIVIKTWMSQPFPASTNESPPPQASYYHIFHKGETQQNR